MKTCQVKGCNREFEARGWCIMHYLRWRKNGDPGEAEPRKLPNGTFSKFVNGKRIWTNKTITRKEYDRRYKIRTGYKSIKAMHKVRFGGLRQSVLERDNYTCQWCGMTNKEHKEEWNCEITVDHIDMTGRYSDEHNHDIDNMWTLCLRCHGKKDATYKFIKNNRAIPESLQEFVHFFV